MDRLTTEQRRKNMQAVKSKDSKIEMRLRQELWNRGLRYRKNSKSVFGHPDIAFIGKKVAVFCDSEFWHGYDWERKLILKVIKIFGYRRLSAIWLVIKKLMIISFLTAGRS